MIGLDTNVLVRHFAKDDPTQAAQVSALLKSFTVENPGYISIVTLVELAWVLHRVYSLSKVELIAVLESLLRSPELMVQHARVVDDALKMFFSSKCEFADTLNSQLGNDAGCKFTLTFDKGAASQLGMRLVR